MFLKGKIRKILLNLTNIALPIIAISYLTADSIMIGCNLKELPHPIAITMIINITMLVLGIILKTSKQDVGGTLIVDKTSSDNRYRLDFNSELCELEKKESFIIKVDDSTIVKSQD